ncbi:MAG: acyl-CoA thioesterase [Crocinitomicaceae bacterium]|nr:acyl-CoA thioesterase [Crocinitomicaceae bacterium]MBK8925314.1 acyl-CoA thioesterase [Crocinitomicaceae bacterium]
MYTYNTQIRIRYSETDRMGYCYYGNYAQFFEIGRVETLRSLGISYKELEDQGIMLPVLDYQVRFLKPAFYDDLLTIKTTISKLPSARIVFDYEILNENNVLISTAQTTLVFIQDKTMKPCMVPQHLLEKIKPFF